MQITDESTQIISFWASQKGIVTKKFEFDFRIIFREVFERFDSFLAVIFLKAETKVLKIILKLINFPPDWTQNSSYNPRINAIP